MLLHYIRMALRQLAKYRFHTAVSVLCMAVGLTINGYIGAVVKCQFNTGNQVVLSKRNGNLMTYAEYKKIVDSSIEGLYGFNAHDYTYEKLVAYSDNAEELYQTMARGISPDFFRNHSDPRGNLIVAGRDSIAEDEIIISEQLAERIFGYEDPIGRTLTLLKDSIGNDASRKNNFYDGKTYRIAGVCSNIYTNYSKYHIYVTMHDKTILAQTTAFISRGYSRKSVQKAIDSVEWHEPENGAPYDIAVIETDHDFEFWITVVLLVLFSLLIFATGLINFMKFMIQMFYSRQRELALRKCLGSNNSGLYMLLASEVLIVLALSFFISCITSELSIIYFDYLNVDIFDDIPTRMIIPVQLHTTIMAFIVALAVIALPIFRLRHASMRGALMRHRQGNKMRNLMIGLQFMVAIISFAFLAIAVKTEKEEGCRHQETLTDEELGRIFSIGNYHHNWEQIAPLLEKLPIVEKVTSTSMETLQKTGINYKWMHVNNDSIIVDLIAYGDPSYFEFFNLDVEGKIVSPEETSYVYIDRKLHSYLTGSGSYDGTITLDNGARYNVAGVIEQCFTKEWHQIYAGGYEKRPFSGSVFFVNNANLSFYYRIKDGVQMKDARKAFEDVFHKFLPKTFEVDIPTLKETLDELNTVNRMMKHVALLMAFISLLVVVLSIYSTISLDAATRQKEIAIRKINGARRSDILRRFVVPYMTVYTVTFLIVYPSLACFYLSVTGGAGRMMSPGLIFAVGAMIYFGIMVLIAAVTWQRIIMIMNVNPADVIRRE